MAKQNLPDAFEDARLRISRSLIESYFSVSGAKWEFGEFWTLNPFRGDRSIGSFHIRENGQWFDHAIGEGGDFINLVARTKNISDLDAAKLISGGDYEPIPREAIPKPRERAPKVQPKYPLPESDVKEARDHSQLSKYQTKFGKWISGFAIRNLKNEPLYFIFRYETELSKKNGKKKKNSIPFYKGVDDLFHPAMPWDDKIPMYGVQKIKSGCKVIIVEGEPKALEEVPGYVLVSPVGGSAKFKYADVEPLKLASEVIVWPDADEPGLKAAKEIFEIIPCKNKIILDVFEKSDGWDIKDLTEEGGDPLEFIENCKVYKEPEFTKPIEVEFEKGAAIPDKKQPPPKKPPTELRPQNNEYFSFLGWDDEYHYFMVKPQRIIMTIGKQSFNSSKLLSIATLSYWNQLGFISDKGTFKLSEGQDFVQYQSRLAGRFSTDIVRGSGVWIDGNHKILNTGRELYVDGIQTHFDKFKSKYVYVTSEKYFGEIEGTPSTDEEGRKLFELFRCQKWINEQSLYASLGWALISNFGGCLNWRPHIFITGKIGSGKSWLLDNGIKPLVGDYAHYGSGSDTEPGIRRSIMQEPRPVVLDEMKIKTKKDESNIANIMNLIRNSSSDASAKITMASPNGGTINFNVRSPFCLSSDQIPFETEDLQSRILLCELETPHQINRRQHEETKRLESKKYLDVLKNPDKFRVRVFQKLENMINDIEYLQNAPDGLISIGSNENELGFFDTNRKRANWAPLIAVIYNILFDRSMTGEDRDLSHSYQWLVDNFSKWKDGSNNIYGDEDGIIYTILEETVKIDMEEYTIAELLLSHNQEDVRNKKALGRFGIKINKNMELCIATNSDRIKEVLRRKHYSENYDSQLKRNELCTNGKEKSKNVRFAEIGNRMSRIFDWNKFKEKYLDGED